MSAFGQWLLDIIQKILDFIIEIPFLIVSWLWQAILEVMGTSLIIGTLETGGAIFSLIPQQVLYFIGLMQIPFGITLVTSAYLLRFFIRRIPFIG